MEPEEIERLDNRNSDWELKEHKWRTTHSQVGRVMKWTTKPVKGGLKNDNTLIAEFKMKMTMIL